MLLLALTPDSSISSPIPNRDHRDCSPSLGSRLSARRGLMATVAAAAARRAIALARTPAPSQAASLIPRRGLAGAADHHGPLKVNIWEDPLSPSKWKDEHFVIVSLTGWGLLFYGGYKLFTKGKGKKEEKVLEAEH